MAKTLVAVGRGRIPLRVRNVYLYDVVFSNSQRLATVSAVAPGSVKEGRELSVTEISPGVVEVSLVDADQELP